MCACVRHGRHTTRGTHMVDVNYIFSNTDTLTHTLAPFGKTWDTNATLAFQIETLAHTYTHTEETYSQEIRGEYKLLWQRDANYACV